MTRKQHWATRAFHAFLSSRRDTPFAWGTNDCALFAADAIEAITGTDIASDFRGKYSDQAGAFATVKAVCGGSTVADAAAYCAEKHGLEEWKYPLMAQRGDLVVVENGGTTIAAVVGLSGHVAAMTEDGWVQLPITQVVRAWHV